MEQPADDRTVRVLQPRRADPPPPSLAAPDGLAWWRDAIAEMEAREFAARRRARDLMREAAEARLDAERSAAVLALRSRRLEEAETTVGALGEELAAARARLAEAATRDAETSARLTALEDELERRRYDADVLARRATGRERELAALREQLRELKAERRVLANRVQRTNAQLDSLRASRGYRFLRMVWAVKRGLLRPFRALRRA